VEKNGVRELNVVKIAGLAKNGEPVTKLDEDSAIEPSDSGVGVTPCNPSVAQTTFPSTITVNTSTASSADGASAARTPAAASPKSSSPIDANRLTAKLKALKRPVEEHPLATEVFSYLQILSACFLSFSHGSNDTANGVGALVGLWVTYTTGYALGDGVDDPVFLGIIFFGAASMIIGLWILGHKVIKTMGTKIVHVTSASGFAMEIGTAFTVLLASKIGIPVSTTHCAVGAIVAVGWVKSHKGGVSWTTFRNIALAWVVTLPVAGAVSALIAYLLSTFVVNA